MEIWRDIKGYEGLYQVSNLGRVKALNKIDLLGRHRHEKMFSLKAGTHGYVRVMLSKNHKQELFRVHRLVAQAFIDNPNDYPMINHKDEDKTNNCVDNLEWCTNRYNMTYQDIQYRYLDSKPKAVIAIDKVGNELKTNSINKLCKKIGCSRRDIRYCLHGQQKTTHGFKISLA